MASSSRLLFVDDDPNLLASFQRLFRKQYEFDTALGADAALKLIEAKGPYAVVLADMNMPGMNGIELLERVRSGWPDTVRVMLTGNADQKTPVEAVNRGSIFRFLNKPCPPEALIGAIEGGLRQYHLVTAERVLLEGTFSATVKAMADVLGLVAPEALGRGQRLRESMGPFSKAVGATPIWELETAALLSSIGCASVPVSVMRKVASGTDLTAAESIILRRVPRIGHDLLADIPRMGDIARIVLYQDRAFDGPGGESDGIQGEAIPVGARMLKILNDRMDLESDGIVKEKARSVLAGRPGLYDPRLLALSFICFPAYLASALTHDQRVETLPVSRLKPGMVVVTDLVTHAGLILVGAGNRLTAMMIDRLRNFAELGEVREPAIVQLSEAEDPVQLGLARGGGSAQGAP